MRSHRVAITLMLAGLALVAHPGTADAQGGPKQLSGVVTDQKGAPLVDAQVSVSGARKAASSDAQGRYRIEGLDADSALVLVRRIGYRLQSVHLQLVPGNNELNVQLEEMPERLDAAITTVEQSGVFGVVGDTAFNILVGSEVSLAGVRGVKITDSTGAFFFDPVRPGANLIEVKAHGYKPRILSFTMPKKGGMKVAVWMTPLRFGLSDRLIARESDFSNFLKSDLADFDRRQRWKTSRAGTSSRDEIARSAPHMVLSDAVQFLPGMAGKGIRVKSGALRGLVPCAIVDGVAVRDQEGNVLDWYNTDEVEMLELYPAGGSTELSNSLMPCTGANAPPRRAASPVRARIASPVSGGSDAVIAVIILRR